MLGFWADRAHPGFVCARHTFKRGQQKGNVYSFVLEANVCLWSLALPSSEYSLNFCLKTRWQTEDWALSLRSDTTKSQAEEPGLAGILGNWQAPPSHRGWVPGWRPGWKLNWPIWEVASGLFSGNFLGPDSSVSSSCLWKVVSGYVSVHC